jgi:hypothetical protein
MAVRHVLAKANIPKEQHLRNLALKSTRGLLDDAVLLPSSTRRLVFAFRQSKQNQGGNPKRARLLSLAYDFIH